MHSQMEFLSLSSSSPSFSLPSPTCQKQASDSSQVIFCIRFPLLHFCTLPSLSIPISSSLLLCVLPFTFLLFFVSVVLLHFLFAHPLLFSSSLCSLLFLQLFNLSCLFTPLSSSSLSLLPLSFLRRSPFVSGAAVSSC